MSTTFLLQTYMHFVLNYNNNFVLNYNNNICNKFQIPYGTHKIDQIVTQMMFITHLHHPHFWCKCNSYVVHIDIMEYQLIIPKAYIIVNSKIIAGWVLMAI